MKSFSYTRYTMSQRVGIAALVTVLLLTELGIWIADQGRKTHSQLTIPNEIVQLQAHIDSSKSEVPRSRNSSQIVLKKFNPNSLNETEWQNLGFTPKQVSVILKYKKSLGGKFSSKEEIKNCFVISDEKFIELAPYILLPEHASNNLRPHTTNNSVKYKKFNPNDYSQNDWESIGFSQKQALTILKYKKSLGGKFTSLDQIQNCFVISEDKFREMKPYMILTTSEVAKPTESKEAQKTPLEKFNPNDLTREQWIQLGFTEKQTNTILNYKNSLGGKFKNAEVLKKCYSISEDKFSEIEPYLIFE